MGRIIPKRDEPNEGHERLLTRQEVAHRYSINVRTVDRWESEGKIPKRIPKWIGHEPRWRESDIDNHIREMCQAERDEQVT